MKSMLERAAQVAIQGSASGSVVDLLTSLQAMPKQAFGDPQAAATMGKQVSRSTGSSQKAEARTASEIAGNAQRTYRKLAQLASTEEERGRVLEAAVRSEERSIESLNRRVDSIERTAEGGYGVVKTIALGAAGLAVLGTLYVATQSRK